MTEEEYFRKNYPDFCYGDKPLSPYWDLFEYGAEFGERQSEEKIEELEQENAELKAEIENDRDLPAVAYMQGAENQKKKDEKQLIKAKELLAKWVELFKPKSETALPTPIQVETEQFLKEIEK